MKISKTTIAAILMSIIMIATTATGCGTKLKTEDQSPVQTQDNAIINDISSNTMGSEQNTSSHIVSFSTSKEDTKNTQAKSSSSSTTSKSKTSTSSITSESKSSTNAKVSNGGSAKKNNSTASKMGSSVNTSTTTTHTPTISTNNNSSKATNSSNESQNTTTASSKTSSTSASTTNKTTNNTSSKQTSSKTASTKTSSKVNNNSSKHSTQNTVVSSTPSRPQTTSSETKTSKPTHQHTPVTKTETKYSTHTASLKLEPAYHKNRHYYEYLVSVFKCAVCGEEAVFRIYCYQGYENGSDYNGMKEVTEVPRHPEFAIPFAFEYSNYTPSPEVQQYSDKNFSDWFHRHYTDCDVSPYQIDHHITWFDNECTLGRKQSWADVETDIDVETTYEWTECSECGEILESKHEISTVEHMPEMEDPVETYWEGPFAYDDEITIKDKIF